MECENDISIDIVNGFDGEKIKTGYEEIVTRGWFCDY